MIDFNKIRVGVVSLTVGNWDLMYDHIQSVYDTYPYEKDFYIVPNVDFGMSLSAAINKGFKRALADGCDYVVYCADDVILGENAIQTVLGHHTQMNAWITIGVGKNASWDFFVASPELFENVGFWDESFYPAYFEDNDFARRVNLAGGAEKTQYCHATFEHIGSQTIKRFSPFEMQKHSMYFEMNKQRYINMWGGPPGEETYTEKWNGQEPDDRLDARKVYGDFKERKMPPPQGAWPQAEDYREFPGI